MPVYASADDLRATGINSVALEDIDSAIVEAALVRASSTADAYVSQAFTLPLTAWDESLTGAVVDIAVYLVMKHRGFSGQGSDETIRLDYLAALEWLKQIAAGLIRPAGIVDSTPTEEEMSVVVVSEPKRGW